MTEFWSDAVGDTLNKSIRSLYVTEELDDEGTATSANFDFGFDFGFDFDFEMDCVFASYYSLFFYDL